MANDPLDNNPDLSCWLQSVATHNAGGDMEAWSNIVNWCRVQQQINEKIVRAAKGILNADKSRDNVPYRMLREARELIEGKQA